MTAEKTERNEYWYDFVLRNPKTNRSKVASDMSISTSCMYAIFARIRKRRIKEAKFNLDKENKGGK